MAKSSPSLDTNCLLRWVLKDIPEQTAAVQQLMSSGLVFYVANAAITEIAFVLEKVYGLPREAVVSNIQTIIAAENINCNHTFFQAILPMYIKHPALSFVDCQLALQAELQSRVPLYTFDKKLAAQLSQAVLLK
jgi:predicted nucleic-acid-binding protein